jgi:hypothetical protein
MVAVGSNTIEDLMDAYAGVAPTPGVPLAAGQTYHSYTPLRDPSTFEQVHSWDAVNPTSGTTDCINAKLGLGAMARPNGSGDGRTALSDEIGGVAWTKTAGGCPGAFIGGEIDLSRSSSPPVGTGSPAGLTVCAPGASFASPCLAWVDFGHDAVSYAYLPDGQANANLDHLTTANLTAIFSSTAANGVTPITINGTSINFFPCLPQLGSGTEKFFVAKINVTTSQAETAATNAKCTNFEENGADTFHDTATAAIGSTGGPPAGSVGVTPFSVGSFISQANLVALDRSVDATGATPSVFFGCIDSTCGAGNLPYVPGPPLAPNTGFYAGNFGRDLFILADNKALNGTISQQSSPEQGILGFAGTKFVPPNIGPIHTGTTGSGAICNPAPGQASLSTFGFVAPEGNGAVCGDEWISTTTPGSVS